MTCKLDNVTSVKTRPYIEYLQTNHLPGKVNVSSTVVKLVGTWHLKSTLRKWASTVWILDCVVRHMIVCYVAAQPPLPLLLNFSQSNEFAKWRCVNISYLVVIRLIYCVMETRTVERLVFNFFLNPTSCHKHSIKSSYKQSLISPHITLNFNIRCNECMAINFATQIYCK